MCYATTALPAGHATIAASAATIAGIPTMATVRSITSWAAVAVTCATDATWLGSGRNSMLINQQFRGGNRQ